MEPAILERGKKNVELLPRSSFRHHYRRSGACLVRTKAVIVDGGSIKPWNEWNLPAIDPLQAMGSVGSV